MAGGAQLGLVLLGALTTAGAVTASRVPTGISLGAPSHRPVDVGVPPSKSSVAQERQTSTATQRGSAAEVTKTSPGLPPVGVASVQTRSTVLPGSEIVRGEPSLAFDSTGVIYVVAPTGLGHAPTTPASPLWRSTDGGSSFQGPSSTQTGGGAVPELGGGDADIVVDGFDAVYVTNLWLGNTTMAVSTDQGNTFTQLPVGHLTPVDDRPWLAYDSVNDALYMAWDGGDGLHVGKTLLRSVTTGTQAAPAGGLLFAQDVVAVPESILAGTPAGAVARECVCPPGTITVEPSGAVDLAYSSQNGLGIARSTDGGLTWNSTYVPGSATGSAQDLDDDFQVLRSDAAGNLYVAWSQAAGAGVQVYFSYLQRGATAWHAPVRVSTTKDAVFGTIVPVSPGIADIAYYGTNDFGGDPNSAGSASWDVYLAQAQDVFRSGVVVTADVYPAVHTGAIDTAGLGSGTDRSLGDFFSIAIDKAGMAGIITAVGNVAQGVKLQYIRQTGPFTVGTAPTSPAPIGLSVPPSTPVPYIPPVGPLVAAQQPAPAAAAAPEGNASSTGQAPGNQTGGAAAAPAAGLQTASWGAGRALSAVAGDSTGRGVSPILPLLFLGFATLGGGLLLYRVGRG